MALKEMQKAIGKLKLFLAEITNKQSELDILYQQFQQQLRRAPNQAIYSGHSVETSLNIMSEIQERLDHVEKTRRHLASIKKRAEEELAALQLTLKVEEAKIEIAGLQDKLRTADLEKEAIEEEIKHLKDFISQSSLKAGEDITRSSRGS